MNKETRDLLFDQAKQWILEAGATIRRKINDPITIQTKSNANDLVTTMDKETEQFFVGKIKSKYPSHYLFSEEGFGDKLSSLEGTVWIIDPIDGTMNFVHQKRHFAISVGIYQDGIGEIGFIYDVMADILYSAKKGEGAMKNGAKLPPLKTDLTLQESIVGMNHYWLCKNNLVKETAMQELVKQVRGTRTYGSAALEFAYVAEGIIDCYLAMKLSPWDIAAGKIIVHEVGGITTNISGNEFTMLDSDAVLTCHPAIHESILSEFLIKGKK
ncbi:MULTISPECIES: inositol monophosphatase family protein [unclassified Virgibacillus]|uniref:inositol monophosphatase family protein n=1 Tax=unclassified Virgibacillus TaxID=2620237 RepID=UPI0024DE2140|nr:inositol monophosphatase family protein [Virgibacillus sp. LDC-1]